jgi:hypothetical protein
MSGYFVRLSLVVLTLLFIGTDISAHDNWISRGGHRNSAGEWCCGTGDCFVVPSESVRLMSDGYHLFGNVETVPLSEAQPSPDGAFWRCKRPDGTRRCFFAPPPNT